MRLRCLQLRVQTENGLYGTTIDFPDGLVVIRADNTMGKSTCVKSIVVALGLEAMLTANQTDLPLPPAVKQAIDGEDGRHSIIESDVFLELENCRCERITVQRTIKGSRDKNLITVLHGPALTEPGRYEGQDFFVNRSGAASREHGFHQFLATFMNWRLPTVQTFDGGEYPLYLQCIFPYFVVEQTRGWSTIQPPIPTHFRIKDAHKRVVEFLLDLDARRIALQRQELIHERDRLGTEWSRLVKLAGDVSRAASGKPQGISVQPSSVWPPKVSPTLMVPDGEDWVFVEDYLQRKSTELAILVEQEIPRVCEIASAAEEELTKTGHLLKDREMVLARLLENLECEKHEAALVRRRLEALEEDIQRNRDVLTLQQMGADRIPIISRGTCPYCHQTIQDALIPLENQPVMSLDENIDFLVEQRKTFGGVLANANRIVQTRERQIEAGHADLARLRQRIRSLRETLVSDGRMPSIAAIQNRIQLDNVIHALQTANERFNDVITQFGILAEQLRVVEGNLSKLPKEDVTQNDKRKMERWTVLFDEQLRQYQFRSLPLESMILSCDTYRPEQEGFDLPTAISASDLIRIIWSYLHGMLELSREIATNHPGLLVFDEPRQQSADRMSFGELLRRASSADKAKQQVVFFTSEDRDNLRKHLKDIPHTYKEFQGRILKKL